MKKVLGLLVFQMLYGCGPTEKESEEDLNSVIWVDTSESIKISRDNSFEIDGEINEVTLTRDELQPNASDVLSAIRTTTEGLTCYSDSIIYLTTITDQSGEVKIYYPSTSDCGNENSEFVSSEEIEELFEIIK